MLRTPSWPCFNIPSYHFGIQRLGAGFKGDLFGQGPDQAFTTCLIADVDGNRLTAGGFDGAADATQRIEVMINRRDTDFNRVEVLIGRV